MMRLGLIVLLLASGVPAAATDERIAIFASGCFWCTEADFDKVEGVLATTSGYIGGELAQPDYKQVAEGGTGHVEAVQVRYDARRVSYAQLLQVFWGNVDPLDDGGQFCDRGPAYRGAIFYLDEEQRRLADASRAALAASGRLPAEIVTAIRPATQFWPAEDYHQDYASRNPLRYHYYRFNCGRDQRLQQLGVQPDDSRP